MSRSAGPRSTSERNGGCSRQISLRAVICFSLALLTACGQVVTQEPSRTPRLSPAPTATPNQPVGDQATQVPAHAPADTATPTITPTPIVHVVEKGDTLQAIAFDFGVSVESLQRANGIENPQFLQVGQRLVIPAGDEDNQTSLGQLLPTPTPQPIRVQGTAFYRTPVDSLLGLGEVANTTPFTLTNVQVEASLLDASGTQIAQTTSFVSTDVLLPEDRCPFSVLFTTPPSDWATYQVRVIRAQEAGALATAYVPLSVTELRGGPSGPRFEVSGVVENHSAGRSPELVEIVVTTYDAAGTVTGFRRSSLPGSAEEGPLAPGGQRAFTVSLITHGHTPDEFVVVALGRTSGPISSGGG